MWKAAYVLEKNSIVFSEILGIIHISSKKMISLQYVLSKFFPSGDNQNQVSFISEGMRAI